MEDDFFKILEVDPSANNEELKKSYRRLAKKWHPDKNLDNKQEAEAKFKQISEAYAVLKDPRKRAVYEQKHKSPGSESSFRGSAPRETRKRKAPPVEKNVALSLEQLYRGVAKKMKITRRVLDHSGGEQTVEETVTIDAKPGWKKGKKSTFKNKGNEEPGVIPSDVIFIVEEKPHPVFKRDNNDLVVVKEISLSEALTGYTTDITTLDGRTLGVEVNNVISPSYEKIVKGEGMPLGKPGKKGDLRIQFVINFPKDLTTKQKSEIKKTLES